MPSSQKITTRFTNPLQRCTFHTCGVPVRQPSEITRPKTIPNSRNPYLSRPDSSDCNTCAKHYYMDLDGRCQICTGLCDGSDTNGIDAASTTKCVECSQAGSVLTALKVEPGESGIEMTCYHPGHTSCPSTPQPARATAPTTHPSPNTRHPLSVLRLVACKRAERACVPLCRPT